MNPNAQVDLSKATFSNEIKNEANNLYFKPLFTDTNPLPVSDFIKQMITLRTSTSTKDRDMLHYVIKVFFDEYVFYNEYPEAALKKTAEMFGGFINEGVVEYLHFDIAMCRVVNALKSKVDTRLFTFGIIALQACKEVLHRHPEQGCAFAQCSPATAGEGFAHTPSFRGESTLHENENLLFGAFLPLNYYFFASKRPSCPKDTLQSKKIGKKRRKMTILLFLVVHRFKTGTTRAGERNPVAGECASLIRKRAR